ncbi:hypothetical protein Cylst_1455 [Cylindrospermum stagnale PCC 7417]|uniref:Lipoprotein n=1 Tax=Cylindrospermum stagnale PCC 7417 TaxID=56107 RepID=K9WV95_9NOST|nr:hypothetical protein [Cylindrospermum stagnale]AFZ23739.1 hypothetical protein Cylst_1455 [Cylindrospermum stagnale PCC 7417]
MKTKMISMIVLTLTGLSLILSGCSNPKDANEGNFKQAINTILAKQKVGCFLVFLFPFPVTVDKRTANSIKPLDSLVKVGLLSSKEITPGSPSIEYSLTPEGQKFYNQPSGRFCIGEAEVDKIINFTPPQSYPGAPQMSSVKYTYKFKTIGKWVEDPEVQATISELNKILETKDNPPEQEITLFLTNNGWVDKL